MKVTQAGKSLIKFFEGLRLKAYQCSAKVWTIGWGHTKGVSAGQEITKPQAEVIFDRDVAQYDTAVFRLAPELNKNQHSACVSLAFNMGIGAFQRSTLRMMANRGEHEAAAMEFHKWVRGGGRILPGLVKRRSAEAQMYLEE